MQFACKGHLAGKHTYELASSSGGSPACSTHVPCLPACRCAALHPSLSPTPSLASTSGLYTSIHSRTRRRPGRRRNEPNMRACAGHMGLDRYDLQLECQRLLFCPVWHLPMASIIIKCIVHNTRRIQGGTAMATASCCLFGMSYLQGYSLEMIDRDDPDP
jgi:hypothetical protein